MDISIVFARWRQFPFSECTLAPPGKYSWTCASFIPPKFTTQTANWSVQLFLNSSRQKVLILYNGPPLTPNTLIIVIFPHLTHDFLGPSKPTTQMPSRSVQPFLHMSPQSVPILYNGMPLSPPLKIPPSRGGFGPHLIHGSLGPPESST